MSHPLKNWRNFFSQQNNDKTLLGMFLVSASSTIAECCAMSQLNWLAVDMEASAATRHDLLHIAQALNGSSMTLFVRVAQNNQQYIEAALDAGVHGIIVPKISSREEAEAVVKASYYPPIGKRRLNPIRCSAYFDCVSEYIKNASQVSCIVQIETREAIENIDAIASVKGIQGLFVGSGDLTLDYGVPGDFADSQILHAIEAVLVVCQKYKLIPGIFAYSNEWAKKYIDMGFKMIGIGNEIKFIRQEINNILSKLM